MEPVSQNNDLIHLMKLIKSSKRIMVGACLLGIGLISIYHYNLPRPFYQEYPLNFTMTSRADKKRIKEYLTDELGGKMGLKNLVEIVKSNQKVKSRDIPELSANKYTIIIEESGIEQLTLTTTLPFKLEKTDYFKIVDTLNVRAMQRFRENMRILKRISKFKEIESFKRVKVSSDMIRLNGYLLSKVKGKSKEVFKAVPKRTAAFKNPYAEDTFRTISILKSQEKISDQEFDNILKDIVRKEFWSEGFQMVDRPKFPTPIPKIFYSEEAAPLTVTSYSQSIKFYIYSIVLGSITFAFLGLIGNITRITLKNKSQSKNLSLKIENSPVATNS